MILNLVFLNLNQIIIFFIHQVNIYFCKISEKIFVEDKQNHLKTVKIDVTFLISLIFQRSESQGFFNVNILVGGMR